MKCKQAADIIKKIVLFQIVRLYHDYSYASQYILIRHVSNQNKKYQLMSKKQQTFAFHSAMWSKFPQLQYTCKLTITFFLSNPKSMEFFFLMWSMPYTCGLGLFCLSLHFCRHPTCLFSDLKLWQCIFAYKMYFALFKTKLQKFSQLFKVGFLSSSSSKLYNFKFVK